MTEPVPKVMVCVDFSKAGRGALDAGVGLARDLGAEVVLVHVLPSHVAAPVYEGEDVQEMFRAAAAQADAEEVLELTTRWAQEARAQGISVRPVASQGPVAPAILDLVAVERPMMVIVGRVGGSGFRRWVLGSVAEEVARRSSVPVLVVPEVDGDRD